MMDLTRLELDHPTYPVPYAYLLEHEPVPWCHPNLWWWQVRGFRGQLLWDGRCRKCGTAQLVELDLRGVVSFFWKEYNNHARD